MAHASSEQIQAVFNDLEAGIDGGFAHKIEPFLEGLYKYYFRCEISGWENVPEHKALFVCNHN